MQNIPENTDYSFTMDYNPYNQSSPPPSILNPFQFTTPTTSHIIPSSSLTNPNPNPHIQDEFQFPRRSNSLSSISYNNLDLQTTPNSNLSNYYSTSVRRITWTSKQDYQLIESIFVNCYKLIDIKTMKIFWDLIKSFLYNNYKLIRNIRQVRDRFSLLFHRYLSKDNIPSGSNNSHQRSLSKSSTEDEDLDDDYSNSNSNYQENLNNFLKFLTQIFKFDQGLKIKENLSIKLPQLKSNFNELFKNVSIEIDLDSLNSSSSHNTTTNTNSNINVGSNTNNSNSNSNMNLNLNLSNLSNLQSLNMDLKRQRSINFELKAPTLSSTPQPFKKLKKKRSQSFDEVKERQKFLNLNNEFSYNYNNYNQIIPFFNNLNTNLNNNLSNNLNNGLNSSINIPQQTNFPSYQIPIMGQLDENEDLDERLKKFQSDFKNLESRLITDLNMKITRILTNFEQQVSNILSNASSANNNTNSSSNNNSNNNSNSAVMIDKDEDEDYYDETITENSNFLNLSPNSNAILQSASQINENMLASVSSNNNSNNNPNNNNKSEDRDEDMRDEDKKKIDENLNGGINNGINKLNLIGIDDDDKKDFYSY